MIEYAWRFISNGKKTQFLHFQNFNVVNSIIVYLPDTSFFYEFWTDCKKWKNKLLQFKKSCILIKLKIITKCAEYFISSENKLKICLNYTFCPEISNETFTWLTLYISKIDIKTSKAYCFRIYTNWGERFIGASLWPQFNTKFLTIRISQDTTQLEVKQINFPIETFLLYNLVGISAGVSRPNRLKRTAPLQKGILYYYYLKSVVGIWNRSDRHKKWM